MYIDTYIYIYTYINICVYIYTYIHTYVRTYIHTYTHAYVHVTPSRRASRLLVGIERLRTEALGHGLLERGAAACTAAAKPDDAKQLRSERLEQNKIGQASHEPVQIAVHQPREKKQPTAHLTRVLSVQRSSGPLEELAPWRYTARRLRVRLGAEDVCALLLKAAA